MSDNFYQELDKVNSEIIENNKKKLADKPSNTFCILYREGEESYKMEYSEYFLEELVKRSNNSITDITDNNELDVRTSNYTYEMYLERSLHKTRDELNEPRVDLRRFLGPERSDSRIIELTHRKDKLENELRTIFVEIDALNERPYVHEHRDEYKLQMLENVPNYMKDSFNIINYPKWGEVIEFDYDKLKAQILDEYMKTGSKDTLEESYKILLQDMEKFPNLYRLKNHKILEISKDMPFEIMEKNRLHREYCLQLLQSTEYSEISLKIHDLRESRPMPATREQYQEWRSTVLKEWEVLAKELWDTIPEKYKTAFNMRLDSRGIHSDVFESL
jgi:hypothetical protein